MYLQIFNYFALSAFHVCFLRSSSQSVCLRIAFECRFGVTPSLRVRGPAEPGDARGRGRRNIVFAEGWPRPKCVTIGLLKGSSRNVRELFTVTDDVSVTHALPLELVGRYKLLGILKSSPIPRIFLSIPIRQGVDKLFRFLRRYVSFAFREQRRKR